MEIAWLEIADDARSWRDAGFSVDGDRCVVGTVEHRLIGSDHRDIPGRGGIVGWAVVLDPRQTRLTRGEPESASSALGGIDGPGGIDGITTRVVSSHDVRPPGVHPNGAFRIDHLVIRTPDTPRTVAALTALGLGQRGHRDTNSAGDAVDMTFFWAGQVLLELSGPPTPDPAGGPSRLAGLAYATDRLDALADLLGNRVTTPREAVQPGRRIAALRKEAGCSTPIAFMSPHVRVV